MAVKLNFDTAGNVENPTMILAYRSGEKIMPPIVANSVVFSDNLNAPSEFSFQVYKNSCSPWDKIKDFRLIWIPEWDRWYEIYVDIEESNDVLKSISATHLTEAELGQLNLYTTEINTEKDIARDDYERPTIFYDDYHPESSLLHRITTKAVNLTIGHVDESLRKIQRTFTFDNTSIYDAFQDIAEEIGCLFIFDSFSDENGKIIRMVSAYDLESSCQECGYRGEFTGKCPKCKSTNIYEGYGEDTTILLSTDNGLDQVTYTTNVDSVKNCFKLEAGDDNMTAAVVNCNPNGSSYIWHVTEESKEDMSAELIEKINSYDNLYQSYVNNYVADVDVSAFNVLVEKYKVYDDRWKPIPVPVRGYQSLMNAYYDTIDLYNYLETGLMPTRQMSDTNAQHEASKLTAVSLSPVAVQDVKVLSAITAKNAVLAMANILVDFRYKVKEAEGYVLTGNTWTGSFIVTNEADEEDTFTTSPINVVVNGEYEIYVKQQIDRRLAKGDTKDYSVSEMFKQDQATFVADLKKYGLTSLEILLNVAEACQGILIEQGVADGTVYPPLKDQLYTPYHNKVLAIEAEIKVRNEELDAIADMQDEIERIRNGIQEQLNFEKYLGSNLWAEFASFRRESMYTNSNFISDGLDNSELFKNANEFLQTATKEIIKSATLQHSITSSLKNLLVMEAFKPITQYFAVGNWIRIQVDEKIYKLRLLGYELNFEDYMNLSVTFSDVVQINDDISDTESILNSAKSMSTTYDFVEHQASKGDQSYQVLDGWSQKGMSTATVKIMNSADSQDIVYDSNGLLCRRKSDFTEGWDPMQLKIINSTMAITDNNWESVKTAVGRFFWNDPVTGELKESYGVNAEVLVGRLLIGEELGIYNENNSMKFDASGLTISNDKNTVIIDPNSDKLFKMLRGTNEELLFVDTSGNLNLKGNITATNLLATNSGQIASWLFNSEALYKGSNVYGQAGSGNMYFGNSGLSIGNNFKVNADGVLECTGAVIAGNVVATGGNIGGWRIGQNSIYRGDEILGNAGTMYFGNSGLSVGDKFKVDSAGKLYATNAEIVGEINATTIAINDSIYVYSNNIPKTNVLKIYKQEVDPYISIGEECDFVQICNNVMFAHYDPNYPYTTCMSINGSVVIDGSLEVWDSMSVSKYIYMDNGKYIYTKDNAKVPLSLIGVSSANNIWIGSHESSTETTNVMKNCYISANNVYKRTSSGDTSLSDERYKTDIQDIKHAEDFIMSLSPKKYKFTDGTSGRYHAGFLAGEVKESMDNTIGDFGVYVRYTFNEDVPIDPDNPDTYICGLRYEEIMAPHIQVTQQHHIQIKSLEEKIQELQSEINNLKERI